MQRSWAHMGLATVRILRARTKKQISIGENSTAHSGVSTHVTVANVRTRDGGGQISHALACNPTDMGLINDQNNNAAAE